MSRLWQQLLVLWGGSIVLAAVLLALDGWFTRAQRFMWLVPYPADVRIAWMTFVALFRVRPLLVTAIGVVPVTAVVGTVILVALRWRSR